MAKKTNSTRGLRETTSKCDIVLMDKEIAIIDKYACICLKSE